MLQSKILGIYIALPVLLIILWNRLDDILSLLYMCNSTTWFLIINTFGIIVFLWGVKIEIELYWSIIYENRFVLEP